MNGFIYEINLFKLGTTIINRNTFDVRIWVEEPKMWALLNNYWRISYYTNSFNGLLQRVKSI